MKNYIEHTLLKPQATAKDVEKLVEEANTAGFLGVCVNPRFVKLAKKLAKCRVISVVGFPLGANCLETTIFEAKRAIEDGADEIDMVVNLAAVKSADYKTVQKEVAQVKKAVGDKILKVILETDLLSPIEILKSGKACAAAGADFVKTSTGFVKDGVGAQAADVKLMYNTVSKYGCAVKASGGIKTKEAAEALIEAGATRLGTSSGLELIK